jgi:hypothetical protein
MVIKFNHIGCGVGGVLLKYVTPTRRQIETPGGHALGLLYKTTRLYDEIRVVFVRVKL